MQPFTFALMSTVALLVWMGFFMMGSLPLLILKHDVPMDSRFIRGLFNIYYRGLLVTGIAATLAFTWASKPAFAAGAAAIAALAFALLHRLIVPRMDALRNTMQASDHAAIRQFRQLHVAGMLLNALQLGCVVFALTQLHS